MEFTLEEVSWCIRLHCNMLYRLMYRAEWIEELKTWRYCLVSSEELAAA